MRHFATVSSITVLALVLAYVRLPIRPVGDAVIPREVVSVDAVEESPMTAGVVSQVAPLLPTQHPPRLRMAADESWQLPVAETEFARFRAWTERYRSSSPPSRGALVAEGVALARDRRSEMAGLIRSHPDRALALGVPMGVRAELPASVVELLEERVDGRGELAVLAAIPLPGREADVPPVWRTATIGETVYAAHVYGRRLDDPTRMQVPLHGLALDGQLAVDENPLRVLESAEVEALRLWDSDPVCGVSGAPAARSGTPVFVDDGSGHPSVLCSAVHAEEHNDGLMAAEENSGVTERGEEGGLRLASAFTEGIKRLILIRVDFSDKAGDPFTGERGTNLVRSIDQFYRDNSYGRAGFFAPGAGSVITPTLRLPRSNAEYGDLDASQLRKDARTAARAAGFVLETFDFDVICFRSVPGYGWAGLGYVGAPGSWVQDAFGESGGVFCHEVGHNFGLNHANFWDTGGESVAGVRGTSVEYGDSFDTMGNASAGRRHFNVRNKVYLNWLRGTDEIQTLTQSGTYRLFSHDQTNSTGLRALRFRKDSKTNYWFEYRARFADNRWLSNGIGIRRARSDSGRQSQLLDVTAGSADGKNDSALVIGRTFSDGPAGLHITPVARVDSDPPAIDVVFNQGPFPANRPPSVSLAVSIMSVAVAAPVVLTATVVDEDGDALAYGWDFGDGGFGLNAARVSYRWSAVGEYVVRCVVSDMKGGTCSGYVVVRVGNSSTFRISGRVHRDGKPLEGVRVFTSNSRLTFTAATALMC